MRDRKAYAAAVRALLRAHADTSMTSLQRRQAIAAAQRRVAATRPVRPSIKRTSSAWG
jgi:hypothetical protein